MNGRLTYVTTCPPAVTSGGVSSISRRTLDLLSGRFGGVDALVVTPARAAMPRLWSRFLRRVAGVPGRYDFFSERNLARTAERLGREIPASASALFFKGTTPWIGYAPAAPYFVYTDMGFAPYFQNTFDPADFVADDVARICRREAAWLERAAAVFFESAWGVDVTRRACGIPGGNFVAVGRGGHVPIPDRDRYDGARRLVLIANRFRQKGGDLALEAFVRLRRDWPDLEWDIVGGPPQGAWRGVPGIRYHGHLDKDKPEGLRAFVSILERAFLLVHPTREDSNPLVITEAGYHGCPAVSVRRFAIPELVEDGVSGILLEPPADPVRLAEVVDGLLRDEPRYRAMRARARELALRNSTWDAVGARIFDAMERVLS